jgi:hypothetical protein
MVSAFNPEDMKMLKDRIRESVGEFNREAAVAELIRKETEACVRLPDEL